MMPPKDGNLQNLHDLHWFPSIAVNLEWPQNLADGLQRFVCAKVSIGTLRAVAYLSF